MSSKEQIIVVPDIGTDDAVKVIEVNVKIGDSVLPEDPLITLESEKASMEIPAPYAGTVTAISVKVGDSIKAGTQILVLKLSAEPEDNMMRAPSSSPNETKAKQDTDVGVTYENQKSTEVESKKAVNDKQPSQSSQPTEQNIVIPDIGTEDLVKVIEVNVKIGDTVALEDPLITLESEKASMEIPSPYAGKVVKLSVNVGDSVKSGTTILTLMVLNEVQEQPDHTQQQHHEAQAVSHNIDAGLSSKEMPKVAQQTNNQQTNSLVSGSFASTNTLVYASPSVRRFANELGVDLTKVNGNGRKNRIIKTDVEQYVKATLAKLNNNPGIGNNHFPDIIPLPNIDFAKFGEISTQPLSRIKKISAANLHRNWVMVPHVTQFDEADITDMESFREKYKSQVESKGYKLTPIVFLLKAAAQALKSMPKFNVSLANDGASVIQKHYYHIGVAVDTPNGLVVPVIRDVDQKGLFQLAQELATISQNARDGKLLPKDMQGGCFTISSLGGIGGTAFTPIVNLPEVAILGVSKAKIKPVYKDSEFVPRLMLPLSLSYDHRVIDGADGARFITLYSQLLADISQLLL